MNVTNKFFAALALPVVGISMASHVADAQLNYQSPAAVQEQNFERHEGQKERKGHKGEMMHKFNEEVTHSVEKIANGVVMTMTTQNAEILEKMQNKEPNDRNENVVVTKVNLENGIQITKTSEDAEVVAQMHERVDKQAERKAAKESITRTVENTFNGVVITMTSTDAEVAQKIQDKEPKQPKNDDVTVERVLIDGGVQIIITAEDEETIEKIQQRSERGPRKGSRKGKRGSRGGFGNK